MLVARPVVLYVRDVPILWLPFMFQDMRPGRHSGILMPQFGFNDLVRPDRSYNRQISNIGYYWAPERLPGFHRAPRLVLEPLRAVRNRRTVQLAQPLRERLGCVQQAAADRGRLRHRRLIGITSRQFNLSTSLSLDLNYASNTRDPRAERGRPAAEHAADHQLGQFLQAIRLGNRHAGREPPAEPLRWERAAAAPGPHDLAGVRSHLSSDITWSPGLSFTNNTSSKTPLDIAGAGAARRRAGYPGARPAAGGSPLSTSTLRSDSVASTGRTRSG